MIHYHGTPISGTATSKVEFFIGKHALVPFPSQTDMHIVSELCQSFVFDNGAFTIWRQGGKLDVDGYIKWCQEWHRHPGFDWALIPDVIDGSVEDNDAMLNEWDRDIRGVPVYHLHEPVDRLVQLAHEWDTVALGSSGEWDSPGSNKWWERMRVVMDAICDEDGRPICRLHGLRMLNPKVFSRLPLTSADSTNAGVNAGSKGRFGLYVPPTSALRAAVIAARIESVNSASQWERDPQLELESI